MYAFINYKIALLIECLLTHITSIRTFTTMYALMFYKTAPMSVYKGAHHYVCVDVLLGYSLH